MNWLTDLIKRLWDFFKSPIEVKPVEDVITPMPNEKFPLAKTPREVLYDTAVKFLGTDASPSDFAPDEFGCAETVNDIHKVAFGEVIASPGLSTTQLYKTMRQSSRFIKVLEPLPGDIIISPTGYSSSPYTPIKNGHCGFVAKYGILSNDSATGLFKENYTLETWRQRYVVQGGYPMAFFRRV